MRIKSFSSSYGNKKSKSELAREKLVQVVVAHVPIEGHNFRPKAVRLQHSVALFCHPYDDSGVYLSHDSQSD